MTVSNVGKKLLNEIFSAAIESPNGVSALRFRADNEQYLQEIDQLEKQSYLERKNDNYFITPLALALLAKENPNASDIVHKCNLVFALLRGLYKDNPGQEISVSEIAKNTALSKNDTVVALRIIIRTPILKSYSNDLAKEEACIAPSEGILKFNSFEVLLQQIQEQAGSRNIQIVPQSYESLSNEEKAALWGCLVADDQLGRSMLQRFNPNWSKSTHYRYYREAIKSLEQKGIIDTNRNPATIAFQILSQSTLREAIEQLRNKTKKVENERDELRSKVWELENETRKLREQEDRLTKQSEETRPLRDLIKDFEKLGVDDNWIRASIALNLVEPVIKKKLEELGLELPEQTKFSEIYEQLQQVLKEKENRELKFQLLTPKHFYDMRSRIDHWGHKYTGLTKKQADNIVDLVTEFLSDVLG